MEIVLSFDQQDGLSPLRLHSTLLETKAVLCYLSYVTVDYDPADKAHRTPPSSVTSSLRLGMMTGSLSGPLPVN